MQRRTKHHLPQDVWQASSHVASVTVCTADRRRWLLDPAFALAVCDETRAFDQVIGYCVMPDHVHLLLTTCGGPLGTIVGRFKGRLSRCVRTLGLSGPTWQEGYWDRVVRRADGILPTLRYILANPVRAGLVESWWQYPWSGAPVLGKLAPDLFDRAAPEDVIWRQVLVSGP